MRSTVSLPVSATLLVMLLLTTVSSAAQSARVSAEYFTVPVFKGLDNNAIVRLRIYLPAGAATKLKNLKLQLDRVASESLHMLTVHKCDDFERAFERSTPVGSGRPAPQVSIPLDVDARAGITYLWLSVSLKNDADIDRKLGIRVTSLLDDRGSVMKADADESPEPYRLGIALRKAWDDSVHTYRIPGMITTDKGTLIAVYDIRHETSRDLPGNVDVGMSRSTDGGKTWEPMRTIIDMGPPHANNGVGDPAILFDPATKTVWVAALWSKGNRSIAGSEPGLSPDSTGQFVLASSKDDGVTWSPSYNITAQVKNPKWHIYFQGPGSGITMSDGTLVFPSQYWDESKKPGMPHSSIIYSKDHGKTWASGVGAKPNTTESQVVETTPGVLMLNMRDNRGGFRSISTTADLGKTWTEHHTSQTALVDPVCMASIIKARVRTSGAQKDILFFSNVADASTRKNTTIKASQDLGESWPSSNQVLLDERRTFGYSTLTRIDADTLGIVYEGERGLYFVRVLVSDILK